MIAGEAGSSSSDGRGSESAPERPEAKPAHRYIYYRLYTKEGALESNNPIYSNDRFISRILSKSMAPPHTVASLKRRLCWIEGLEGLGNGTLYPSLSTTTILEDSFRLSLRGSAGPGSSESEPMALVVEISALEKRSAPIAVDQKTLPERREEPRYFYYRVYDERGEVKSKTSFNETDSALGRIDIHSIPPPHTVSSLKSCLFKVEEISSRDVQLFEDEFGETVLNDDDIIPLSSDHYPGIKEDEPIAIVYESQKSCGASKLQDSPRQEPAFSKQIQGKVSSGDWVSTDPAWLSRSVGEIFKTDGILRREKYRGSAEYYECYLAINSAGKKGFMFSAYVDFC